VQAHKYLTRHAEPEAQSLVLDDAFDFALVLPCYDEERKDIERFANFCAHNNALLILVVNQPEAVEHCERNDIVLHWLKGASPKTISQHISLCRAERASIMLVDRTRQRIPQAQGVGLARRIGADCAFALITQGIVQSPWIFCTDADAYLPEDYFSATKNYAGCSTVIYPFEHVACGDAQIDAATALYELRLHHYVAGLQRAKSPYAFHSLGSTLAINASHYAAAHGFPKRAGGEDFYLLNKLVKLAPVKSLSQPTLQLRARASHRVPFGTGPAVEKLAGCADMQLQPLLYHDDSFTLLAVWLDFFNVCADKLCRDDKPYIENAASHWREWLATHANANNVALLLQTINGDEFESTLKKANRQCRDAVALQRYLHVWFDGFRTLKLLHALRDAAFPLRNFRECFGEGATLRQGPV